MRRLLAGFFLLLGGTTLSGAAAPAPVVKAFTLTPAVAPVPALKYQLLPPAGDLTPGNAATIYYRGLTPEYVSHRREKDIDEKMTRWRNTSLKDLPLGEMAWLRRYRPLLDCDEAARRQMCDWDLVARIRKEGFAAPLGDLQIMRDPARLLQLRARLEMASGQTDRAVYTLQTALGQARHLSESPTLITALIAAACASMALDEVEELIQQPETPNLYWALSALPRPFIDMRQPIDGERAMITAQFGDVKVLSAGPLPREQLDQLQERHLSIWGLTIKAEEAAQELAAQVEKLYPEAHKKLIQAGFKADHLKTFPPYQVVLLQALREYQASFDDAAKWLLFPYWQSRPRLQELAKSAASEKHNLLVWLSKPLNDGDDTPSTVVAKIASSPARIDRRIAVLRCIEAVRLHAAKTGELPKTLAGITVVPVPIDPITGKEFEYQLKEKVAIITLPTPEGLSPPAAGAARYELSLAK
jgi:hypothetical protein